MKRKIGIVLVVALGIELVNFFFLGFPIDVGYPPDTPWYIQVIGGQWVLLHLLGLRAMDLAEVLFRCRNDNIVMACNTVDRVDLFIGGYLTTVAVGIAGMYSVRLIQRLRRRRRSGDLV